jgi:hypothetical protein
VAIVLQLISRAVVSQKFAKRLCPGCPERRISGWSQIGICAPFEQDPHIVLSTENHGVIERAAPGRIEGVRIGASVKE